MSSILVGTTHLTQMSSSRLIWAHLALIQPHISFSNPILLGPSRFNAVIFLELLQAILIDPWAWIPDKGKFKPEFHKKQPFNQQKFLMMISIFFNNSRML